ncbi:MAG: DEAD/DEAH box helicase family protein [Caulobacterales bacterium]|nr:DEAD/DEAH box helicase family protein [Caulobacterales bacterium]
MLLKPYQRQALGALSDFLALAQEHDPAAAFETVVNAPQPDGLPTLKQRLGRYYKPYKAAKGLDDTPYVCLRLPTGGGKTILAAHAIAAGRDAGIGGDYPLVLWLVPSEIIQSQTAGALRDPKHPYRQALDAAFDGRVRVFDIADYAQLRPQDLAQNACIVIGTIQTLRVTDTNKRKVYAHHEDLEPHFSRLDRLALQSLPDLERDANDKVKFSFANLLHLHRPLMLVDEAHNAVTGLSDEMRRRINPAAVVEFTATPKDRSNILFNVTAAELKQEAMIKLPIVLQEHAHWQAAVVGAMHERQRLAALAEKDPAYIRPLALYQAEPKDREVTVEVLRRHLIDDLKVPEDRVVVATGVERGLEGVNLLDPACRVEHIITVEALKEGWDAPFAYVFCSVSSIRSATAVEQLLGRVLRMPYAQRRGQGDLNKAYAHVSEPSFREAAEALKDTLIDMGFDDAELPDVLEHATQEIEWGEDALFGVREPTLPAFVQAPDTPQVRAALAQAGVTATSAPDGGLSIRAADLAKPGLAATLVAAAPGVTAQVEAAVQRLTLSQIGQTITVPRLVTRVQGELAFDLDEIMGLVDWRLSGESAEVPGLVEALDERVRRFEIDVDRSQVVQRFLEDERDLFGDAPPPDGWTPELLVNLLAPLVRDESISHADALGWLSEAVRRVLNRGQSLSRLMRMKHVLARRLRIRVVELKAVARQREARRWLIDPGAPVETLASEGFVFRDGMYDGVRPYRGRKRFNKHFLPMVPAFDGTGDGEEADCALALDAMPQVETWVRNVARHPGSFWLQTSKDRTYPDFVARLTDGRIFVVEYKGADRWNEAEEDRAVGMAWERVGGGLYLMVRKSDDAGRTPHMQMRDKLDAA